jgi:hypothetical protein
MIENQSEMVVEPAREARRADYFKMGIPKIRKYNENAIEIAGIHAASL